MPNIRPASRQESETSPNTASFSQGNERIVSSSTSPRRSENQPVDPTPLPELSAATHRARGACSTFDLNSRERGPPLDCTKALPGLLETTQDDQNAVQTKRKHSDDSLLALAVDREEKRHRAHHSQKSLELAHAARRTKNKKESVLVDPKPTLFGKQDTSPSSPNQPAVTPSKLDRTPSAEGQKQLLTSGKAPALHLRAILLRHNAKLRFETANPRLMKANLTEMKKLVNAKTKSADVKESEDLANELKDWIEDDPSPSLGSPARRGEKWLFLREPITPHHPSFPLARRKLVNERSKFVYSRIMDPASGKLDGFLRWLLYHVREDQRKLQQSLKLGKPRPMEGYLPARPEQWMDKFRIGATRVGWAPNMASFTMSVTDGSLGTPDDLTKWAKAMGTAKVGQRRNQE